MNYVYNYEYNNLVTNMTLNVFERANKSKIKSAQYPNNVALTC